MWFPKPLSYAGLFTPAEAISDSGEHLQSVLAEVRKTGGCEMSENLLLLHIHCVWCEGRPPSGVATTPNKNNFSASVWVRQHYQGVKTKWKRLRSWPQKDTELNLPPAIEVRPLFIDHHISRHIKNNVQMLCMCFLNSCQVGMWSVCTSGVEIWYLSLSCYLPTVF